MATTTLPKVQVRRIPSPVDGTLTHAFEITCDHPDCQDLGLLYRTRHAADIEAIIHQREHATGNLLHRLLVAHDTTPVYVEDVTP